MKKIIKTITTILLAFAVSSCFSHNHQALESWSMDETNHWHECIKCEEQMDVTAHEFGGWEEITPATETTAGLEKRYCEVCGYEQSRDIQILSHVHHYNDTYSSDANGHYKECSCGDKSGYESHSGGQATATALAVCEVCGREYGSYLHVCSDDNKDGICECGRTIAGYFDKTIDGCLDDWTTEEKADALKTFEDSGVGFSVIGYHDNNKKAYFATTIVTKYSHASDFEIFQKDGLTRYVILYDSSESKWKVQEGSDKIIAFFVNEETKDGLNYVTIESLWNFDEFPVETSGNYKINFAVNAPEDSQLNYGNEKGANWTLYGLNPWNDGWLFELTTSTKFGHAHLLNEEFVCVICNENQKIKDSAIVVDGKIDDWDSEILDTMVESFDEEDRWIRQVGFIDDKYVYLYVSIAHREPVGDLNVIIGCDNYANIKSGAKFIFDNVDDGAIREYRDDTDTFNVTDYEFVISLSKIMSFKSSAFVTDGVKIGVDISNTSGEESEAFSIDNKLHMWGIAGQNSWNVSTNPTYTVDGLQHVHKWGEDDVCLLCGMDKPEGLDGIDYVQVSDGAYKKFYLNSISGLYEGEFTLTEIWQRVYFDIVYKDSNTLRLTKDTVTFAGSIRPEKSASQYGNPELFGDRDEQIATGTYYYAVDGITTYVVSYDEATNTFTINVKEPEPEISCVTVSGSVSETFNLNEETGLYEGSFTLDTVWSNVYFDVVYVDDSTNRITNSNTTFAGSIRPEKSASQFGNPELFADQDSQISTGTYYYAVDGTTTYLVSYDAENKIFTITVDEPTKEISKVEAFISGKEAKGLELDSETGLYETELTFDTQWSNVYFKITYSDETEENITVSKYTLTGSIVPTKGSNTADERLYADQDNQVATGTYYYPLAGTTKYNVSFDYENKTLDIVAVVPEKEISKVEAFISGKDSKELELDLATGLYKTELTFDTQWSNVYFKISYTDGTSENITKSKYILTGSIVSEKGNNTADERLYADKDDQVATGTYYYPLAGTTKYNVSFNNSNKMLVIRAELVVSKLIAYVNNGTQFDITLNKETGLFEGSFTFTSIWQNVYIDIIYENGAAKRVKSSTTTMTGLIRPEKTASQYGNPELFADQNNQVATGTYYYAVEGESTYIVTYNTVNNTINFSSDEE